MDRWNKTPESSVTSCLTIADERLHHSAITPNTIIKAMISDSLRDRRAATWFAQCLVASLIVPHPFLAASSHSQDAPTHECVTESKGLIGKPGGEFARGRSSSLSAGVVGQGQTVTGWSDPGHHRWHLAEWSGKLRTRPGSLTASSSSSNRRCCRSGQG